MFSCMFVNVAGRFPSIPREHLLERVVMFLFICEWMKLKSFLLALRYSHSLKYAFWIRFMANILSKKVEKQSGPYIASFGRDKNLILFFFLLLQLNTGSVPQAGVWVGLNSLHRKQMQHFLRMTSVSSRRKSLF